MGYGLRVRFRHYHWRGERPLRLAFPLLFSLTRCKDATVVDCLEGDTGFGAWNVKFAKTANDWELDEFSAFFFSLLYS